MRISHASSYTIDLIINETKHMEAGMENSSNNFAVAIKNIINAFLFIINKS